MEKFWSFYIDTFTTTFLMEHLTQRLTQLGPLFQNQGTFFYFQIRAREASHSSLVAHLIISLLFYFKRSFFFVIKNTIADSLLTITVFMYHILTSCV